MPLNELFQAGEYEQVIERGREAIEAHPEYALPLYNLACTESLAGHKDDAIEHLRRAIERQEPLRSMAAEDSDFDADPRRARLPRARRRALAMAVEEASSRTSAPASRRSARAGSWSTSARRRGCATTPSAAGACSRATGACSRSGPDLEPQQFDQLGFTLAVLEPGKPTGHVPRRVEPGGLPRARRHAACCSSRSRSAPLRAWDFVHCPPGTRHTFVGTGDEPCVIFMTGARRRGRHDRLPGLGDGASPRRRRRDRDAEPARGVRAVRPLAARPARPRGPGSPGARASSTLAHASASRQKARFVGFAGVTW